MAPIAAVFLPCRRGRSEVPGPAPGADVWRVTGGSARENAWPVRGAACLQCSQAVMNGPAYLTSEVGTQSSGCCARATTARGRTVLTALRPEADATGQRLWTVRAGML